MNQVDGREICNEFEVHTESSPSLLDLHFYICSTLGYGYFALNETAVRKLRDACNEALGEEQVAQAIIDLLPKKKR